MRTWILNHQLHKIHHFDRACLNTCAHFRTSCPNRNPNTCNDNLDPSCHLVHIFRCFCMVLRHTDRCVVYTCCLCTHLDSDIWSHLLNLRIVWYAGNMGLMNRKTLDIAHRSCRVHSCTRSCPRNQNRSGMLNKVCFARRNLRKTVK